ncbi:MAG TPA: biopolymer transporter ExbD [Anaeromyxobacteraceae bacterium]|nr:biopolymer transporter ExbD [Anaeromyxobacteraceae bacterium]
MRRRPYVEEHAGELNIVPYLDIVSNLVIFMLLSMTGLFTLGVVNVSAPRMGAEAQAQAQDQPKLLLTVAISKRGFYIAGAGGVLGGAADQAAVDATQPPTLPLGPDGKYDYAGLTERMKLVKDRYPNETNLILSADAEVPYEVLIQTMDACRETRAEGSPERRPLFFDVSLSILG